MDKFNITGIFAKVDVKPTSSNAYGNRGYKWESSLSADESLTEQYNGLDDWSKLNSNRTYGVITEINDANEYIAYQNKLINQTDAQYFLEIIHTVESGETVNEILDRYYGNHDSEYKELFYEHNAQVDPVSNDIYVGQEFKIYKEIEEAELDKYYGVYQTPTQVESQDWYSIGTDDKPYALNIDGSTFKFTMELLKREGVDSAIKPRNKEETQNRYGIIDEQNDSTNFGDGDTFVIISNFYDDSWIKDFSYTTGYSIEQIQTNNRLNNPSQLQKDQELLLEVANGNQFQFNTQNKYHHPQFYIVKNYQSTFEDNIPLDDFLADNGIDRAVFNKFNPDYENITTLSYGQNVVLPFKHPDFENGEYRGYNGELFTIDSSHIKPSERRKYDAQMLPILSYYNGDVPRFLIGDEQLSNIIFNVTQNGKCPDAIQALKDYPELCNDSCAINMQMLLYHGANNTPRTHQLKIHNTAGVTDSVTYYANDCPFADYTLGQLEDYLGLDYRNLKPQQYDWFIIDMTRKYDNDGNRIPREGNLMFPDSMYSIDSYILNTRNVVGFN